MSYIYIYIYGAPILDVSRSHTTKHHSRQDSSGRVISLSQRPLPDNTRHSQQTNIHAPGGIRTQEQVWKCNVTLHVHTCSGRNRIIPLMRRPNTDSTPKKPVTLPSKQLLIRYAVTSPVHTVTIRCCDTRLRYKCVPTLILQTFCHMFK